jgi:glycine/D-amino acid oxidase-like deaminating enzyme
VEIQAGTVAVAAGPWSTKLLATAGVEVPISALRVQVAIVHRPLALDAGHLVYLDTVAGMFARPWFAGRSLVGISAGDHGTTVDPDSFDHRFDPGFPEATLDTVAKRLPAMAGASLSHGYACLYDMTPDAHSIISGTPVSGLYLAAGFSGAGFKKGPGVGEALSELILDGKSSFVDLTPFRLSRFDDESWRQPWSDTEYVITTDFGHGL